MYNCVHRTHKLVHIVNKFSLLLKLTIIAYSYTNTVTIINHVKMFKLKKEKCVKEKTNDWLYKSHYPI